MSRSVLYRTTLAASLLMCVLSVLVIPAWVIDACGFSPVFAPTVTAAFFGTALGWFGLTMWSANLE